MAQAGPEIAKSKVVNPSWGFELERSPVNSTNVATAGYDAANMILEVEFQNGNIYQYFDVPETVYEQFVHAPSPGQFLNTNIKGVYRYSRL
jgi:hypothetical protein